MLEEPAQTIKRSGCFVYPPAHLFRLETTSSAQGLARLVSKNPVQRMAYRLR